MRGTPTGILEKAKHSVKDVAMNDSYVLQRIALYAIANALAEGWRAGLGEAESIAMKYMENADEEGFKTAEAIATEIYNHKRKERMSYGPESG